MKKDKKGAVKTLAEFTGYSLNLSIIDSIVSQTTFEKMRRADNVTPTFRHPGGTPHIRRGIVGDWKNHFSKKQSARMDAEYKKRLAGTGLHLEFE